MDLRFHKYIKHMNILCPLRMSSTNHRWQLIVQVSILAHAADHPDAWVWGEWRAQRQTPLRLCQMNANCPCVYYFCLLIHDGILSKCTSKLRIKGNGILASSRARPFFDFHDSSQYDPVHVFMCRRSIIDGHLPGPGHVRGRNDGWLVQIIVCFFMPKSEL